MSYKVGDLVLVRGQVAIIDSITDLTNAILLNIRFANGCKETLYDQEVVGWYW